MSGNKNEEIVDLVTDIAYKFKRLESLLGVPLNQSNSSLPSLPQKIEKEEEEEEDKEPEIKTFNVSGYNSDEDNDEEEEDEEHDEDKVPTIKKQNGSNKKKKSNKKKSSKKRKTKNVVTKKKGGKGNAFTKFMGKKIKQLKKKHPKKSHGEIFKMAAGEYKKSKK